MTTFSRNGFWRTSASGNLHWVTEHMVDRADWERTSGSKPDFTYLVGVLANVRAGNSVASTYVTPNAECPVCGAAVFFYRNGNGSRVFFDELGPPWPKHPCTLSEPSTVGALVLVQVIEPTVRQDSEIEVIEQWLSASPLSPEDNFLSKYHLAAWTPFVVEGRFSQRMGMLLVLRRLGKAALGRVFMRSKRLPKSLVPGSPIYYYRGWISYLDTECLEHEEVKVERLAGATGFLDALLHLPAKLAGT